MKFIHWVEIGMLAVVAIGILALLMVSSSCFIDGSLCNAEHVVGVGALGVMGISLFAVIKLMMWELGASS